MLPEDYAVIDVEIPVATNSCPRQTNSEQFFKEKSRR